MPGSLALSASSIISCSFAPPLDTTLTSSALIPLAKLFLLRVYLCIYIKVIQGTVSSFRINVYKTHSHHHSYLFFLFSTVIIVCYLIIYVVLAAVSVVPYSSRSSWYFLSGKCFFITNAAISISCRILLSALFTRCLTFMSSFL